jgi:hypothetical protein
VLHNSPERRRKIEKKREDVWGDRDHKDGWEDTIINIPMLPYWHNSGVSRPNKFYLRRVSFSEAEDVSSVGNFLFAAGFGPIQKRRFKREAGQLERGKAPGQLTPFARIYPGWALATTTRR